MQEIQHRYEKELDRYRSQLAGIKKRLYASSMLRLLLFLVMVAGTYLLWDHTRTVVVLCLAGLALFLFLVSRHTNLQYKRKKLEALIQINTTELRVLQRDFAHLPNGAQFKDPGHYYSEDIDLFGEGSFYQYMNRTALPMGSTDLANLLKANNLKNIAQRQEAVKELAQMLPWRQEFLAIASLAETQTGTDSIVQWLKGYDPFISRFISYLPWLFTLGSVVVLLGYFMQWLPEVFLMYWVFAGLLIVGFFGKKIRRVGAVAGNIMGTFVQYRKLMELIEEADFTSAVLMAKKRELSSHGSPTSKVLKEFATMLGNLDRNNNIFYLVLGNGLFLNSLYTCTALENWIKKHGANVEHWFAAIAFFDAYISLGNFAHNHPGYTYPVLNNKGLIAAKQAGHPLLDAQKCVKNDYALAREDFFIVTGANMAGKSTFLRTVSLQLVMANTGLPVCADAFDYSPIKLITSMRTSDSLTNEASYFFAELQRLKFVVDKMREDRYFIVLDEILKGTNSVDKAQGSRQFLERLVRSGSTGIIATHDLSLCQVANAHPQVRNLYFDAEIVNGELHFDYTLKQGVCKNMNASFLLRKMGIVQP